MDIVLIRHAEPEWVLKGLNVVDPPLTRRGHEQAELLGAALGDESFDEVHVSPLVRACQTAAPLFARLGVGAPEDHVSRWLEEIRDPGWHGTPAELSKEAYRAQVRRPPHEQWEGLPGGEPVRDFVARVRTGGAAFFAEHGVTPAPGDLPVWHVAEPDRKILLVAHAGTNSVIINFLLGLPSVPWEWERFVIHHASVSRLEAYRVGDARTFTLTDLSDVRHLPPAMHTR